MDIKIKNALEQELIRQKNNIELIASENYVSEDILKLQGSIFTNKYAEGYCKKRYYGGCENVDSIEELAIKYVTELFECKYANVQPHSGSSANMAVYRALLNPGDVVMGLNLSHGGHLTHGHKASFSGQDYSIISYNLNSQTEEIDYETIEKHAIEEKPKMIIAGASAYPRKIDFKRFRKICDKCGAILMVDMAHIAGLVAARLHENPCKYADVVTSTTHKTLRGPRGGFILTNSEDIIKKINKTIFPGIQGGPLMHVIAAKAECFYEALQPSFKKYQMQVLSNIKAMEKEFLKNGVKLITNGTDNHLLLIDVNSSFNITGKKAQDILEKSNITVNKNTIVGDKEPIETSGIRIGSPAMTTKGLKEKEFSQVANMIINVLNSPDDKKIQQNVQEEVMSLLSAFPDLFKKD